MIGIKNNYTNTVVAFAMRIPRDLSHRHQHGFAPHNNVNLSLSRGILIVNAMHINPGCSSDQSSRIMPRESESGSAGEALKEQSLL